MSNNSIKAMLVSVGGTPQPIITSIKKYHPEFVSFFASQETVELVFEILNAVKSGTHNEIEKELTIVDDVNDLYHCYQKAEDAVERINRRGYSKDEVIVDYTGGTKNMSVSLALAAIVHGFSFSYVGGKERTKEGIGVVINGHEEVYESINPWDFLAIEERKRIALLFNTYQFKAAKELANEILKRSTRYRSVFKKLGFIIDGYYNWDLFRHRQALDCFKRAKMDELIEVDDPSIRSFARETERLTPFLEELALKKRKPDINYILDLYANAERRFKEGKVDDAILRLYRVVEMIVQEKLLNMYGIDSSDAREESLPERLREDFAGKYKSQRDGKIKIPQSASFELLYELGDEIGKRFKEQKSSFLDIQNARNHSYLAHGFVCSKDRTYRMMGEFVLALQIFKADDAPLFPKMEI